MRATSRPRPAPAVDDAGLRHDIANRLFFRLYQASNLMHKTGTRALAPHGTTTQQWAVMGALARPATIDAGMSVKELMEFLMVSRQSLTAVLDRLEGSGLLGRARGRDDGRVRRVRLTRAGRATWAAMGTSIRGYYGAALAELSTEEAFLLHRLLDRLRTALAGL